MPETRCDVCGKVIDANRNNPGALMAHKTARHKGRDSWSNPAAVKEPSGQVPKGTGFWRSLGGVAAEGAKQGVERRAEGVVSGEGKLFGGSSEKRGGFWKFFKIVIIFAILFYIGASCAPLFGVPLESGFYEAKIVGPAIKPVAKQIDEFGRLVGVQLKRTGKILRGEETFSLEGEVEEREKFGLELGDIQVFGLSFGNQLSRVEPFGIRSKIIVNKLDESVETIPAKITASIPTPSEPADSNACPDKVEGIPKSDFVSESGDIKIKNPYNPEIQGLEEIPVDFTFDDNELTNCVLKKAINLVTINLNLSYNLDVKTTLEVFAVTKELYDQYLGTNRAFKELGLDRYRDYDSDRVLSKMRYRSEVEAFMKFDFQPVLIDSDKELAFQFKNNDVRNNARIKSFTITPPMGMEFRECDYLDVIGEEASLKAELLEGINNQINSGLGESSVFRCRVHISQEILGGASGNVISGPQGVIEGDLAYDYTTSKSKDVTINKPPETAPEPIA